jgi:hypothetical protein
MRLLSYVWNSSKVRFLSLSCVSSVNLFVVNVIIVIGHEKLNVEMRREFGNSLAVVKIPKSGGVSCFTWMHHLAVY